MSNLLKNIVDFLPKMAFRQLISIASAIFLALHVSAQVKIDENGDIESTEIIIEKNKKITFPEAPRKFEKIPPAPKKNTVEPKEYTYKEFQTPLPDLESKIKIATIKDELSSRKKINYVRAGAGNYFTSYFEGQLLFKTNPKFQTGLHARHFGAMRGPVKNSGNSSNLIEGNAKYFFKKSILSGSLDYTRSAINYYGYNQSLKNNNDSKFQDSIYQVYQQFHATAELKQIDTLTKKQYYFRANYYTFGNRYKNSENEVEALGFVGYEIDPESKIRINGNLSASNYTDSSGSLPRYLFNIKPEYERKLLDNKLIARGGINFAYDNDTLQSTKRIHVYPTVHLDYELLPKLHALAGVDGGMEKNTYRQYATQNPFLGLNPLLLHTNKRYEFYGGFEGNISPTINFKSILSYANYQNMSVYVNGVADSSRFDVFYAKNASVLKLRTDLGYEPSQALKIGLRATYFHYQTDTISHAWHRPAFDATAYVNYNMFNKLWFSAEAYYLAGIKAKNYQSGNEYTLDDIIDINLSANYKINERFSVFLYFYNILAQKYERYYQYPVRGITIVGGLTYTF